MEKLMKQIFPLLIALALLPVCTSFQYKQKPKVTIEKYDIEEITFTDLTIQFDVGIQNPYPIGLSLDDIIVTFELEKKQFFKTNTAKGFKIKANGKAVSSFKVNLKYADIYNIIKDYAKKDYLESIINVEIIIPLPDIPGLDKNFIVKQTLTKKIPAVKPKLDIDNFNVDLPSAGEIAAAVKKSKKFNVIEIAEIVAGSKKLGLSDLKDLDLPLTINFDVLLKNNTDAKLTFSGLNYDFMVNSEKLVAGDTTKIQNQGAVSRMTVSNKISSKTLGGQFINAYKNKKGQFAIKGSASLKLPDEIQKKPVKFIINETGDLAIK